MDRRTFLKTTALIPLPPIVLKKQPRITDHEYDIGHWTGDINRLLDRRIRLLKGEGWCRNTPIDPAFTPPNRVLLSTYTNHYSFTLDWVWFEDGQPRWATVEVDYPTDKLNGRSAVEVAERIRLTRRGGFMAVSTREDRLRLGGRGGRYEGE